MDAANGEVAFRPILGCRDGFSLSPSAGRFNTASSISIRHKSLVHGYRFAEQMEQAASVVRKTVGLIEQARIEFDVEVGTGIARREISLAGRPVEADTQFEHDAGPCPPVLARDASRAAWLADARIDLWTTGTAVKEPTSRYGASSCGWAQRPS
jgi:hypothetical protein